MNIVNTTIDDAEVDLEWTVAAATITTKWDDVEGDPLLYVTITHPDFAIRFSNLFEDGDHNIQLTYDDRDNMVGEFTGDFVKFMSWLTEHGGVDGMRAAFEEAKAEYQPN
ncbi:hypothetical protein [Sphingobium yanoikuyae]|jgi:hypothetical protein|nr:hypothetical protein [Sphingobium yanoikuyae]